MTIPLPNFDDRASQELIAQALRSFKEGQASDREMVLVKLLAELSEMLLYRANQIPHRHYEAFLELLNAPGWQREGDLKMAIAQTILDLRRRYRAVTPEDFESLTLNEWPDTEAGTIVKATEPIVRVQCFGDRNLTAFNPGDRDKEEPGHISIAVVPQTHLPQSQALSFDGIGDRIRVNWHEPETAIIREIWFKTSSPDCGLCCVAADNFSDRDLYLDRGHIKARLWREEIIATTGVNFADDRWHCLVHQFGRAVNGQQLYIDGVLVASGEKYQSDFYWNDRLFIAYSPLAKQPYFCGQIATVRIWKQLPSGNKELLVCCQWDDPTLTFVREQTPTQTRSPSVPMQIVNSTHDRISRLRIGVDTLLERGDFEVKYSDNSVETSGKPQTVVAIPTPYPSANLRQKLWQFLDDRRLLTVRHHVVGPEYVTVKIRATLQLKWGADVSDVRRESIRYLCEFFDPIAGGQNRRGWPWGFPIRTAELYPLLESVPGVDRAANVTFLPDNTEEIRLKPYQLPAIEVGEHSIEIVKRSGEDGKWKI